MKHCRNFELLLAFDIPETFFPLRKQQQQRKNRNKKTRFFWTESNNPKRVGMYQIAKEKKKITPS
jgi:hypothetical protein